MTTDELKRAIVDIIDLHRMDIEARSVMSRHSDEAWTWESSCRHVTLDRARMVIAILKREKHI